MRDDNLVSNRETFFRKIAGFLGEKEARKWRENKGTSKLTMSEFLHHDIREMRVYHTTEGIFSLICHSQVCLESHIFQLSDE